jgi:hypothetical protein
MSLSELVQQIIYALEVGRFARWLQLFPLVMAVIGLAVLYDLTSYRCFNSPEAMDAAQVARHLATGKGYTTDYIRPFSVYLLQKHNRESQSTNALSLVAMTGAQPDLANAPVYPMMLAGLIKVVRPDWKVETRKAFWSQGGRFMRYQMEFTIALMNQMLLVVVVALTFFIARKLFDGPAAWLAVILTLGADWLWRFSVSGQSTLLLLVIYLSLVWCLLKIEELGRGEKPSVNRLFMLAITAGVLTGAGMLTRYAFGWVIVPVVVFLTLFGGVRRPGLAVAASLAFVFAVAPWIIRNLAVCGAPFGTAGYAVVEGTFGFPGTELMQSLNPELATAHWLLPYINKFLVNTRYILQDDLLRIGGSWVAVLFFAGLMLGLQNTAARRLRYFTMMCLGMFVVAQALGTTQLSSITPDINSENLLVLLTPLVVIFGVAIFMLLLNQMKTPSKEVRFAVILVMVLVSCQTFIANLLPPKISPVAYPPYFPPEIQRVANWLRADELMMSDIPWAVAWYGQRQCVSTTINSKYEFFQFNDYVKNVSGLYLTLNTLNQKLYSECLQGGGDSWGNFVLKSVTANQIPPQFPLKVAPAGLVSGVFLTDRQRWATQ